MNVGDIIGDALAYPFHNVKALVVYVILGIIAALIGGTALFGLISAAGTQGVASFALGTTGIVGLAVFILVLFLIEGYGLDIVKFGIERRNDSPSIEFGRQIVNAVKLIVVDIVYYIVPVIIIAILGVFFRDWILIIISVFLIIVFALANFMARCRLAKTEDLGDALAIGQAIGDISRVGFGKLLATVIVVVIIAMLIIFIIGLIAKWNPNVGNILLGIASVYLIFFCHRSIGLLYSTV